ncbi:hypothetical protein ACFS07_35085 [Undibacterium arcticum]
MNIDKLHLSIYASFGEFLLIRVNPNWVSGLKRFSFFCEIQGRRSALHIPRHQPLNSAIDKKTSTQLVLIWSQEPTGASSEALPQTSITGEYTARQILEKKLVLLVQARTAFPVPVAQQMPCYTDIRLQTPAAFHQRC